jgi:hypothetical protein
MALSTHQKIARTIFVIGMIVVFIRVIVYIKQVLTLKAVVNAKTNDKIDISEGILSGIVKSINTQYKKALANGDADV